MSLPEKLFKNELERTRELVQSPDWYMKYGRIQKKRALGLGAVQVAMSGSATRARRDAKLQELTIFERLLHEGAVRLGDPTLDHDLPDFDEDRQPIDHIVLHHTKQESGIALSRLSAMELLRLYVPRFQKDDDDVRYSNGSGKPLYSGHFDEHGQQVFYPYHWLVNGRSGKPQRLLDDKLIGWHAGNWKMNTRSIAIAIDDNLTDKDPTPAALASVAEIMSAHYGSIDLSPTTLLGHRATHNTVCPGNTFDPGWKQTLLAKLG